jgi:hypothetical protein
MWSPPAEVSHAEAFETADRGSRTAPRISALRATI